MFWVLFVMISQDKNLKPGPPWASRCVGVLAVSFTQDLEKLERALMSPTRRSSCKKLPLNDTASKPAGSARRAAAAVAAAATAGGGGNSGFEGMQQQQQQQLLAKQPARTGAAPRSGGSSAAVTPDSSRKAALHEQLLSRHS